MYSLRGGKTALDVAKERESSEIITLLQNASPNK